MVTLKYNYNFLFAQVVLLFYMVLQFKPQEITAIMNDFTDPGSLAPTGLYLGGTKYMVIQGEPGAVIRGKKVWVDIHASSDVQILFCLMTYFPA